MATTVTIETDKPLPLLGSKRRHDVVQEIAQTVSRLLNDPRVTVNIVKR